MRGTTMQRATRTLTLAALACLLLLGACRSRPMLARGTQVTPCDTLCGRLVNGRCAESFTFEGVESSLLCFDVRSDCSNISAPRVSLTGPDGQNLPVAAETTSRGGASTTRVRDVVLMRSGTYRVTVTPTTNQDVYYTFTHALKFPGVRNQPVNLVACQDHAFTLSAPRGGLVTVQIRPHRDHCTQTQFQVNAVEDPWGGRALDPASRPPNAPAPEVRHQSDGSYFLHFVAPISGRYTVYASAKPGHEGPAFIDTCVKPPRQCARRVMHPNTQPSGFGVPAPVPPQPCVYTSPAR